MPQERLQKLMARAGLGSRRQCETYIKTGRVKVNGSVAKLGQRANPKSDTISFDDRTLNYPDLIYIKLNKPKGIISSTTDELRAGRTTIRDLIEIPGHLFPIGRLDKQSEGLMLLTNDGPLTHRLTHPRYGHTKVYEVLVAGHLSGTDLSTWRKGIPLDGRKTARAKIIIIGKEGNRTRIQITMREGRKRQIRRIAASLGYDVIRLVRLQIGPVMLGDLKPGKWAYLTDQEITSLRDSIA